VHFQSRQQIQRLAWLLLSALGLMALLSLGGNRARADEVTLDEGGAIDDVSVHTGMSASNPRVEPILAAHPGKFVVICVAGCPGKPSAVQVLPGPAAARVGGYVPTMGKMGSTRYGPPRPAKLAAQTAEQDNNVICEAGCPGRAGQIVQRMTGLPPVEKATSPKTGTSEEKRKELLLSP
jgi:hypothetical protein